VADVQEPTDPTRLGGVAEQLYGLPLEEFTATRDARAKELRAQGERDLARDVAALRRPTTAAWAVNQLVRARRDEVEQLLALGAALRDAQGAFAGEELRELNRQQHRVIAAIRQRARAVAALAGQRLTEVVGRQVEATLKAGMADPAAADAVRSGLLVSDLESTGFDPVDLTGAVAVGAGAGAHLHGGRTAAAGPRRERAAGSRAQEGAGTRTQQEADRRAQDDADRRRQEDADRVAEERRREERERALAEARALVARTTEALADAEDVLATAVAAASDARARREAVAARLAELRAALEAAEADDAAAAAEVEVAEESRARARRDADAARWSAEEATAALARLDREG
jgi:hypothetical protein